MSAPSVSERLRELAKHATCPTCKKGLRALATEIEAQSGLLRIDGDALAALRAALERIEGEMRAHRKTWLPEFTIIEVWADELRAAREGGK